MKKKTKVDRILDHAIFDYFEERVRRVVTPEPTVELEVPRAGRATPPFFRDLLIHGTAVAAIAGLTLLFPLELERPTPLSKAVESIVEKKTYLLYLPRGEYLRDSISTYFKRRIP